MTNKIPTFQYFGTFLGSNLFSRGGVNGVRKVTHGVRKVTHGVRKVTHGTPSHEQFVDPKKLPKKLKVEILEIFFIAVDQRLFSMFAILHYLSLQYN